MASIHQPEDNKTPPDFFAGTVEVGDFFVESWGYDQTNVDFYQVVRVAKSGASVWLRHVRSEQARRAIWSDGAHDRVVPVVDGFDRGEGDGGHGDRAGTFRRKLTPGFDGDGWVSMTSYSGASRWDGRPLYQTAGH